MLAIFAGWIDSASLHFVGGLCLIFSLVAVTIFLLKLDTVSISAWSVLRIVWSIAPLLPVITYIGAWSIHVFFGEKHGIIVCGGDFPGAGD